MRPGGPADGGPGTGFRLRSTSADPHRTHVLRPGRNLVGSGRDCDIRLDGRGISRRHAEIEVDGDRCTVVDLGSKNGTTVDDRAVTRGELATASVVAFGASAWRLEDVDGDDLVLAVELEPPLGEKFDGGVGEGTRGDTTYLRTADGEPPDPPPALPKGVVAGVSAPMRTVYRHLSTLSRGDVPVLVVGETGVGKEHLARALHDGSQRRGGPFVAVNCAALPAELMEAELFGIGKGVATGVAARPGRIRQADGGTLFLDELADLALPLQAKLLRVLQEGEVVPLGERPATVDVRWVAATNVSLEDRIADGRFRADLYYRLSGFVLEVPPLRDRPEDLPGLVAHFLRLYGAETHTAVRGMTVKAMGLLQERDWPGNVRQLAHELRTLVYRCADGQVIDAALLGDDGGRGDGGEKRGPVERLADRLELGDVPLAVHLEALERRLVQRALESTGGNQSEAARVLGVSRNGLAKRLRRLGLSAR
ncbi:MAG: sigma 54-interacting transcriptional regulator [Acidobacteriota bacterium]